MKAFNGIVAAAATLLVTACAPGAMSEGSASPEARKAEEPVTVTVRNNNWSDMIVYVVRGSARSRLGMVTSLRTETFTVPRASISGNGTVQLYADPVGSLRGYLTEAVPVRAGQQVSLDVGSSLSISFVSVRN
jgi:hypothetical protein